MKTNVIFAISLGLLLLSCDTSTEEKSKNTKQTPPLNILLDQIRDYPIPDSASARVKLWGKDIDMYMLGEFAIYGSFDQSTIEFSFADSAWTWSFTKDSTIGNFSFTDTIRIKAKEQVDGKYFWTYDLIRPFQSGGGDFKRSKKGSTTFRFFDAMLSKDRASGSWKIYQPWTVQGEAFLFGDYKLDKNGTLSGKITQTGGVIYRSFQLNKDKSGFFKVKEILNDAIWFESKWGIDGLQGQWTDFSLTPVQSGFWGTSSGQ